jgi:hypothetical protein
MFGPIKLLLYLPITAAEMKFREEQLNTLGWTVKETTILKEN